jgi:hypothetical protein
MAVKVGTLTRLACLVFVRLIIDPARLLCFETVSAASTLVEILFCGLICQEKSIYFSYISMIICVKNQAASNATIFLPRSALWQLKSVLP